MRLTSGVGNDAGFQAAAVEERSVRIIRDEAGWDALRPEWDTLHAACPAASPPLHFDWQRGWWRHYGGAYGGDGPLILTLWRERELVGLLPMYLACRTIGGVRLRELRPISTGEPEREETCPDYLNLLYRPGEEATCAAAVWAAVAGMSWDRLVLPDLPGDSPLLDPTSWPTVGARPEELGRGICLVTDLTGGFETYLKGLSSKTRQHARQYLRAGERPGAAFELAAADTVDAFFDDLVRLHQERWTADGQPGCFASDRFTAFHRDLLRAWVPSGRAVLARLSHQGRAYCALYGFVNRDKCDYYQSGIARGGDGPFNSPGNTANLLLMRTLAGRGVTAYDFLGGTSDHKHRWATREVPTRGLQLWRPTWRATLARSVEQGGRFLRRGWRTGSNA